MIERRYWGLRAKTGQYQGVAYGDRGGLDEWIKIGDRAEAWEIIEFTGCRVCGRPESHWTDGPYKRCSTHQGRTPCAIDGCDHSTTRYNVVWICSTHWRTACPPGSKERKAYNRLFRLARKFGSWPPALNDRFWIVWRAIVRRGNARVRGDIDEAEIKRLFGW